MRIGFFADEYLPRLDGVILSMLNSARGLRELGHEVYFIVPAYPHNRREDFVIRVPSTPVPLSDNVRVMVPDWRTNRAVAKLKLDIIHSHTPLTSGTLARAVARQQGRPLVATFHTLLPVLIDYYPIRAKTYYFPGITALISDVLLAANLKKYNLPASAEQSSSKRWAWRMTGAFADAHDLVLSPSHHYAKELEQLGLKTPLQVIPTGLDLARFKPIAPPRPGPIKAIAVGRLSAEKRQDVLLEAMAGLDGAEFSLELAGAGPARSALARSITGSGLDNVRLLGSVPPARIPTLLRGADVGVLASHGFDTQCLALVEYMAAGLPILYCDPNLTEVVGPDAGLLVKPDAKSLATGLAKLKSSPALRRKMSAAGLKRSRRFTYRTAAKALERSYQRLISDRVGVDVPVL